MMERISSLPEGGLISAKDFLHIGNRAAINRALSRRCIDGTLLRIVRGIYTAPVTSRFGIRAPSSDSVVDALTALTGEVIVHHGAIAANMLGLTNQVAIRQVYLTARRSKILLLGKSPIDIIHAPYWMIRLGARPAGDAVRALAWLGSEHVHKALNSLHRIFPSSEWDVLVSACTFLPAWMAKAIRQKALMHV